MKTICINKKNLPSLFSFGFEIPVAGATWWPTRGKVEEMGSEFLETPEF